MLNWWLFVSLQWLFRGLERSSEDHIRPPWGPILRELDWLWQPLGWFKEWLDEPSDQQVRPGPVLGPFSRDSPRTWALKYCGHFSMHDATGRVALEYGRAKCRVFVPSWGPRTDGNLWSTERWSQNLSRASSICALLACNHLYRLTLRQKRNLDFLNAT